MDATLNQLANNTMISVIGGILITLLAGVTAFLANKNIAVFNDGVRPLVGQKRQGNLKYRALASMSFAMSIGYVVGFIPFSLASNILIMHTVLLGSEMIGLIFPNQKKYTIASSLIAMCYGAGIYWGLQGLSIAIDHISYPGFGFDLGQITDAAFPFIFALFPAIATFIQSGAKKGTIAIVVSVIIYLVVALFGWAQYNLYPMAITLLAGSTLLFTFAIIDHRQKQALLKNKEGENQTKKPQGNKLQLEIFTKNVAVIKQNKWWFVLSGALAAMAITTFAGAPLVSMSLQTTTKANGDIISALIADTTWVIGFMPLVVLTALLTGVYSPVGLTLVFVWGDIAKIIGAQIVMATNQENMYLIAIALSGLFGALSLFGETYLLKGLAVLLQKVPSIQKLADSMRTSISKTINVAFIFGGVIAAFVMGQHVTALIADQGEVWVSLGAWLPAISAGLVLLFILINKMSKKQFAEIAIGPLGAISVGILLNIIYFIALAT